MTFNNFCFYLQDRLIQTSQTGGQWYSVTSPFSIPWLECWALQSVQDSRLLTGRQHLDHAAPKITW
jgi:hypothetical protein